MPDHELLDQALNAGRLGLDPPLSWSELAVKAGVSDVSLRNFRKGRGNPNALSRRRIEAALGWKPGSIDAILNGGQAMTQPDDSDLTADELRHQIASLRDEIEHLEVRYEANRAGIVRHLEQQIVDAERKLKNLQDKEE